MSRLPPGAQPLSRSVSWGLAIAIAALAGLHLSHLGHGRLRHWDEVYHFKVATSLLADPLAPRLRVDPLRPVSQVDWWNCEVWLHKPILPFWASALSMKVLGVSPYAFRLPSALLACLCAWLTFLLGRRAGGPGLGLFAAALFASNAFAIDVVQGVQFGDVTDIHLAAWNLLAVVLLLRGATSSSASAWALSGAAVGLAVLSKLFLALAPLCLGPVAWTLCALGRLDGPRIRLRHVALQWACALLVAGPVLLYLRLRFPAQFDHSFLYGLHHLDRAIEPVWVHGPDWTWNEMLQRQLGEPFALLGAVAITAFACTQAFSREPARALTAIWLGATMLVLSVVRMKAPGQLFGAFPAACVAIAWLVMTAARRPSPLLAGLLLGLGAQVATWPWKSLLPAAVRGVASLRGVLPDLVDHPESARGALLVAGGLAFVLLAGGLARFSGRPLPAVALRVPALLLAIALAFGWPAFAFGAFRDLRAHWWRSWSQSAAAAIALQGPKRSAVFIDGEARDDRLDLELEAFSGQPALGLRAGMPSADDLRRAAAQGRSPLLVSARRLPFAVLEQDPLSKRFEVYDLSRPALPLDGPVSFGIQGARARAAGAGSRLLGAALEAKAARRGATAWMTSCWQVERPAHLRQLRILGVQGSHRFDAAQPLAYGLLDGRLKAGDAFCQRSSFDLPADAARGEADLWLALGELAPVPSGLKLLVE